MQADESGTYEVQLAEQSGPYLRGVYHSGPDGRYAVKTIAPLGYAIPMDGPVGELIHKTDISYFRPAHIHFMLSAPGYQKVITHLFKRGTEYLENDVVFGVKQELIADFVRHGPGVAPPASAATPTSGPSTTTSSSPTRTAPRRPRKPRPPCRRSPFSNPIVPAKAGTRPA